MPKIHKNAFLIWPCVFFILASENMQAQLKADFSFNPNPVCTGIEFSISNKTSGGTLPYSFFWDYGNGTSSTTKFGLAYYTTAGKYNIKLVVTDATGKKDSLTKPVKVLASPEVVHSANLVPGYCSVISFQATDTSSTESGSSYLWVGEGAPGYAPLYIKGRTGGYWYTRGGTYHYTLIVTGANGCKSTYYDSFSIAKWPGIRMPYYDTTVCSNTSFAITATPFYGTPPYTIWWGDRLPPHSIYGETLTTKINKDTAFGVWMSDVNGCENYDSVWVRALPSPNAKWALIDSGKTVYLHAVDSSYTDSSYHWNFGDGHSAASYVGRHTYTNESIYDPSLTVTNSAGCSDKYDTVINTGNFSFYLYPNPFHSSTSIQYILTQKTMVQILLYDINGKFIERVTDETQFPGFHQESIGADKPDLAPGAYILKINMDDTHATFKILKF